MCSNTLICAPECRKCIRRYPNLKIFQPEGAQGAPYKLVPSALGKRALSILRPHLRVCRLPKFLLKTLKTIDNHSAGNNFSLFRGHMSFQIFLLVGHLTNWTGHNLLTDNTLKKRTQDVLVTCSAIVSDHNVKLAGHFQNLVGQCQMTDCYFQHWITSAKPSKQKLRKWIEIHQSQHL